MTANHMIVGHSPAIPSMVSGRRQACAPPCRFYLLDALRGVAALSVVLWHWYFFFLPYNLRGVEFVDGQQPFAHQLSFAYEHGNRAVELFFCLSGFVFFCLYQDRIARGWISFFNFAILRFARLYPLHLATLLFVLILQLWHRQLTGRFFVYDLNDARHFILNVFLASSWGFDKDFSFNGPIWSVSVEVLLYGIFFFVCRLGIPSVFMLFALSFGGGGILSAINVPVANGVAGFFVGGLAFRGYLAISKAESRGMASGIVATLAILGWVCAVRYAGSELNVAGIESGWALRLFPTYVLFPLTIVTLSLIDTFWPIGRHMHLLGDISYSVYLLHFPLQLASAVAFARMGIDSHVYLSQSYFFCFFSILIVLSFASHKYFEMPFQVWLRSRVN